MCSGACMCAPHLLCREPPRTAVQEYARWLAYMREQDPNFRRDEP